MSTYSFLDVVAAIAGPGGAFSIGSDAGISEEGISVEMAEEKNTMTIGASGQVMHSLHAGKSGNVTIRLLKTSPVNRQLSQLYNLQTSSSALHGQNQLTIRDRSRGDVVSCKQVAFAKNPAITFAKDGGMNEWTFQAGEISYLLGSGAPAL